jgi:hypothetical protein
VPESESSPETALSVARSRAPPSAPALPPRPPTAPPIPPSPPPIPPRPPEPDPELEELPELEAPPLEDTPPLLEEAPPELDPPLDELPGPALEGAEMPDPGWSTLAGQGLAHGTAAGCWTTGRARTGRRSSPWADETNASATPKVRSKLSKRSNGLAMGVAMPLKAGCITYEGAPPLPRGSGGPNSGHGGAPARA